MLYDLIIVGGGAAGFFTAINVAEINPGKRIAILERGKEVLSKVRISGGGRCNVTHAEFIPKELSKNYPRGEKELLGPFHSFMTGDTMQWFEGKGVPLKIEEDGRIFPTTDSSQSIVDCFISQAQLYNIEILTGHAVKNMQKKEGLWEVMTSAKKFCSKQLMIATGSSPKIWSLLSGMGHKITDAVPSLFTFNIKDPRIKGLPGLATEAVVRVANSKLMSEGPVLITHWGLSGPAILKLSSWGAIELHSMNYRCKLIINWLQWSTNQETFEILKELKITKAKQLVFTYSQFDLPKRLWQSLVIAAGIPQGAKWADLTKKSMIALSEQLTGSIFEVNGKSTFKEEFVTAGGVDLKEVDFKTFESKKIKNLFFAGEVLNIDAVTGGFNFQNAWTGAYLAAKTIAQADNTK